MHPSTTVSLDLGDPLPGFRLPEPLTGRLLGPDDYPQAKAILVAFLVNGCPEVQQLAGAIAALALDVEPQGVQVLAINSADDGGQGADAPADVAAEALRRGYVFPYLIDQTQRVARAFGALQAPDFYLFGRDRALVYHGALGEARGEGLLDAIERELAGRPPADHQPRSQGCALRWREP